mmetsp:Transcript_29638/g.47763  ORF Transcript_29638/g.47763 Transcript_29638/m.47763 type:complete len:85 (+) Transcript_29638:59-313(+)
MKGTVQGVEGRDPAPPAHHLLSALFAHFKDILQSRPNESLTQRNQGFSAAKSGHKNQASPPSIIQKPHPASPLYTLIVRVDCRH